MQLHRLPTYQNAADAVTRHSRIGRDRLVKKEKRKSREPEEKKLRERRKIRGTIGTGVRVGTTWRNASARLL